jgi:Sec7-like guanine-nucleotide exchange factor
MHDAAKMAEFLIKIEGINKGKLGEFFGSSKEIHQQILYAYCKLLKFTQTVLDEALRLLLERLRLPGEAQ